MVGVHKTETLPRLALTHERLTILSVWSMGDVSDGDDDIGQCAWAASALAVLTVQAVRNRTVDDSA